MEGEEFHWLKQNEREKKSIVSDLKKALKDLEMHFMAVNTGWLSTDAFLATHVNARKFQSRK